MGGLIVGFWFGAFDGFGEAAVGGEWTAFTFGADAAVIALGLVFGEFIFLMLADADDFFGMGVDRKHGGAFVAEDDGDGSDDEEDDDEGEVGGAKEFVGVGGICVCCAWEGGIAHDAMIGVGGVS